MITPEEFVTAYMEAYQRGETLDDLGKHFGMSHNSILSKTGKFRSMGVKLPKLKTKRDIDVAALNVIVERGLGHEVFSDSALKTTDVDTEPILTALRNMPEPTAGTPQEKWRKLHANDAPVPCKRCGAPFQKLDSKQIFCSSECKVKYHHESRPKVEHHYIDCKQCGRSFLSSRVSEVYCSRKCIDSAKRERLGIVPVGKFTHRCRECGKGFYATHNQQVYCSSTCEHTVRLRDKRDYHLRTRSHECPECGKKTTKLYCSNDCRRMYEKRLIENQEAETFDCTICGKKFMPYQPNQKTCSKECAAEKNRRYTRSKNAANREPRYCKHCGKQLGPYGKIYCCANCKWADYKKSENPVSKTDAPREPERIPITIQAKTQNPKPVQMRNCEVCGKSFKPIGRAQKLCGSRECSKERAKSYMAKYRQQEVDRGIVVFVPHSDNDLIDKGYYKRELAKSNERLSKRLMPPPPKRDDPEKIAAAIAKVREENRSVEGKTDSSSRMLQTWRTQHRKKEAKKWPDSLTPINS